MEFNCLSFYKLFFTFISSFLLFSIRSRHARHNRFFFFGANVHTKSELLRGLHLGLGGGLTLASYALHVLELIVDVLLGLVVELLLFLGHFVLGYEVLIGGLGDTGGVIQIVHQAVVFWKSGRVESLWNCRQT